MPTFFVDVCNGYCFTEYFDDRASCNIVHRENSIHVKGNAHFFYLLAKQMLYFACNDFSVPYGSHVHYEKTRHIGHHGLELILEVIRIQSQNIVLDADEGIHVKVDIPQYVDELYKRWHDNTKVYIKSDAQTVHILGDANGLIFIATVLLFMAENGDVGDGFCCEERRLTGWQGNTVIFTVA